MAATSSTAAGTSSAPAPASVPAASPAGPKRLKWMLSRSSGSVEPPPPSSGFSASASAVAEPNVPAPAAGPSQHEWLRALYLAPSANAAASAAAATSSRTTITAAASDPADEFVPRSSAPLLMPATTTTKKKKNKPAQAPTATNATKQQQGGKRPRKRSKASTGVDVNEEPPKHELEEERNLVAKWEAEKFEESDSWMVDSDEVEDGEVDREERRRRDRTRFVLSKEHADESDEDPRKRPRTADGLVEDYWDSQADEDDDDEEDSFAPSSEESEEGDDMDVDDDGDDDDANDADNEGSDDEEDDADDNEGASEEKETETEATKGKGHSNAKHEEEEKEEEKAVVPARGVALAEYLLATAKAGTAPPELPSTPSASRAPSVQLHVVHSLSDAISERQADSAAPLDVQRSLVADANRVVSEMVNAACERVGGRSRSLEPLGLLRVRSMSSAAGHDVSGGADHLRALKMKVMHATEPCVYLNLARLARRAAERIAVAPAATPLPPPTPDAIDFDA